MKDFIIDEKVKSIQANFSDEIDYIKESFDKVMDTIKKEKLKKFQSDYIFSESSWHFYENRCLIKCSHTTIKLEIKEKHKTVSIFLKNKDNIIIIRNILY